MPASPPSRLQRLILIVGVLSVHLALFALTNVALGYLGVPRVIAQHFELGFCLAEVSFFALLFALMRRDFLPRAPWVLLLILQVVWMVWISIDHESGRAWFRCLFVNLAGLIPVSAVLIPFMFFRERLCHMCDPPDKGQHRFQFGILELLIWTAAIGCVFGLGRFLQPSWDRFYPTRSEIFMSSALLPLIIPALAAWPILCIPLSDRWRYVGIVASIAWLAPITYIASRVYLANLSYVGQHVFVAPIGFATSYGAWLLLNAIVLRVFGYRLEPLYAGPHTETVEQCERLPPE